MKYTATQSGLMLVKLINLIVIVFTILLSVQPVEASDSLFFLESQFVLGYSSTKAELEYYSFSYNHPMQKPSLGFDYLHRFSSDYGDRIILALQGRIAWNNMFQNNFETQVYNAYIRGKLGFADIWFGHSRPAFGLSSYLDTHAHLLQNLSMEGFGYDRDWGAGLYKVYNNGDINLSLTSGSGMPFISEGNYLINLRTAYGVIERDNFNIGLSIGFGNTADFMGYHRMNPGLSRTVLTGIDCSYFVNNHEFRLESVIGDMQNDYVHGFLFRYGINFFDENRLKIEFQPVLEKTAGQNEFFKFYTAVTFIINEYLTLRSMYNYSQATGDGKIICQLYLYKII
ncbi:MAG: hypothetical protein WC955_02405 [Elusimicrobiota bacterium]